ncbi:MAG: dipeptidase [Erysipelotrichaceae bacterium]|nr:dipeptidase [Erysipelotrichaceae bacterium]
MKYVDMHCDTITCLYRDHGSLRKNDLHIDIEKMEKGGCLLQNFAVFTYLPRQGSDFAWAAIDYYHQQLKENSDKIRPVYHYEDILRNEEEGYISGLLTLEEGAVIDNDLKNLERFYEAGVRMIALTWNFENGIGFPNFTPGKEERADMLRIVNRKDGLTDFGIEYVKKMEELGMIVDVSHLSDKGFYDVLKYTEKPFVASHSNARAVCSVARNLDDEMIGLLAKRGGVMGLNYCSSFIEEKDEGYTSLQGMVDHIRHIVNVGGIDVIGLGSDFDGIGSKLEIKDASGLPLLYEALRPYFSEEEIEKIFYKNVLRVYQEVFK